jgi:cation:H+ antiporter
MPFLNSTTITLVAGLGLLILGAEFLVRGASRLASGLGVSPLIVGLTVVAYGTSSAELAACLRAAFSERSAVATSIVVGSNIFNVLFVLGVSALITPLVATRRLIRLDVPIMIAVSALVYLLALDGVIGRWDGILLFSGAIIYTAFTVRAAHRERSQNWSIVDAAPPLMDKRMVARFPLVIDLVLILLGLVMLVAGARWLVDGSISIAKSLGLGETVIGLTIVAASTSLPEAATSIAAALRGKREIAVGNVVGSNIANILLVLGVTGIVAPHGIEVLSSALRFDIPVMIAVAISCLPVFFIGGRIARWEGALYLGYYIAFVLYLILEAGHHAALPAFNTIMVLFVLPLTVITLLVLMARTAHHNRRRREAQD